MTWSLKQNMVTLTLCLEWKKYLDSGQWNLPLPPPSVGVCVDWRNVVGKDGEFSVFYMSWNITKLDNNALELFVDRIQNYVTTSETPSYSKTLPHTNASG
jgi:hypothetical protein